MRGSDWPASPVQAMGTAVNPGFCYFRSGAKGEAVVRLITESVVRGLIEFYLRWNNIASPILTLTRTLI